MPNKFIKMNVIKRNINKNLETVEDTKLDSILTTSNFKAVNRVDAVK